MNIVITLTKPLSSYRDSLIRSLKKTGPYTDDTFVVVCSTHEREYNIETYDMLSEFANNVKMTPYSLAPFDSEARTIKDYMNEVMGYNLWRLKIEGETAFIPANYIPTMKGWSKVIRDEYRQCGVSFYGPMTGEDTEQWIDGPFVCDAEFITTNPCVRGYNKNEMFMYRARHYTNRSCAEMTLDYYSYTEQQEEKPDVVEHIEKQEEPAPTEAAKKAKKKTAKKAPRKKAKKKAAKKKATKKPLYKKEDKPSIKDTLKDLRDQSSNDS